MHINIIFDVVGTHISRYDCHFRAYDYLAGRIAPNWAQLALIWGQLAPNWANLGPTCTNLEPTLAQLASIWRQLRPTCYQFGVDAPDFPSKRGTINVKIIVFSLVFVCFSNVGPQCNFKTVCTHLTSIWCQFRPPLPPTRANFR